MDVQGDMWTWRREFRDMEREQIESRERDFSLKIYLRILMLYIIIKENWKKDIEENWRKILMIQNLVLQRKIIEPIPLNL